MTLIDPSSNGLDGRTRPGVRHDLEERLRAKALVLALQADMSVRQAAIALETMAGTTSATPIAVRRAVAHLRASHSRRPTHMTAFALEAMRLVEDRLPTPLPDPSE